MSLNEEGRKRREDEVEETLEKESSSGRLANFEERYERKSKELGQVVDVQPRDLPSLFARSARRAAEEQRNSTNEWSLSRN